MNENASKITKKVAYTTFVAAMGSLLDGYDLAIIGGAFLFLIPQWKLNAGQTGLLGSLAFAGMIIGALVFGRITDKVGRKSAFIVDLALFVIGGLLCAFANDITMLAIGRFLVGFGIGADLPISTALIAEISPTEKRGFLTGLMQAFWFGGSLLSAIVSIIFAEVGGANSWRWMFASGIVIAVIVMLLRAKIPESPRWLLAHGRTNEAKEVLPEVIMKTNSYTEKTSFGELFSAKYRSSLFVVCLFWFLVTIRGAAFVVYTPAVLQTFGLTSKVASFEMNCILFVTYTVVSVISAIFIDRIGRRSIIMWGWGIATIITFVMAFVSHSQAMALFSALLFSTIPIQTVTVALFPWSVEFFPTKLRASAQSFAAASGKLGGLIASLFFPIVLAAVGWQATVLIFFAIMAVGFLIGFIIKPVETSNRSLEEIEAITSANLRTGEMIHESI